MKRKTVLLFCFLLLVFYYCDLFEDDNPYSGITETTIEEIDEWHKPIQVIISEDPDDWKCNYNPKLPDDFYDKYQMMMPSIGPAYINPCTDSIYIFITWPENNYAKIYIKNGDKKIIRTLYDDSLSIGYHYIYWYLDDNEGNKVNDGIYRCYYNFQHTIFIDSTNKTFEVSGYGDIKIE